MDAGESNQQSPNTPQIDESDSLLFSFPSQPPDIKIWFPSYQYESPESSDSSHGLEDEKIDLFLKDETFVKSRNPLVSEEQRSQNEYSLESDSFTIEGKKNLLLEEEPKLESSGMDRINSAVLEENGFISTKNRDGTMRNGESSKVQGLAVNGKKRNRVEMQKDTIILGKERPFLERRGLADQTNALLAEEAIAEAESGKWKCPRKSKPYAGPPMKQLRMGRWVRRVV